MPERRISLAGTCDVLLGVATAVIAFALGVVSAEIGSDQSV